MRVGTVKEIKNHEYRVGLTPESAKELVVHGHEVWVNVIHERRRIGTCSCFLVTGIESFQFFFDC